MHILLVEPDTIFARAYQTAFERQGHTVAHTTSAQTAVYMADERMPDIVVLELQLPNHNGVEFLYEFRSYSEWLAVPIVLHTFVPLSELGPAATLTRELGVVRMLYKPATSLSLLCSAVQAAVPAPS